ncbi:MAG: hypothetical protein QOJ42_1814, partial [Acidobacteriaceae bacterium]|nr:hypothetical protein [Acidobacteriaceae bacterium]
RTVEAIYTGLGLLHLAEDGGGR